MFFGWGWKTIDKTQKNIQQDLKNDDKKKNRLTPIVYWQIFEENKKPYSKIITKNFKYVEHGSNKPHKEGSKYICLSFIVTDSVFKLGKYVYPLTFLEKYKCQVK